MDRVVKTVLDSMSMLNKPQKTFMALLFSTLIVVQGKANFRNMSRYCEMSEKRFSRWYRRAFDFQQFNERLVFGELPANSECIAAIDASFMRKSGKSTEGLGMFYHGGTGSAERGLELSLISVIHLKSNTAFALDACQTLDQKGKTRVDLYAEQTVGVAPLLLKQNIHYLACDAYYAKKKYVSPVTERPVWRLLENSEQMLTCAGCTLVSSLAVAAQRSTTGRLTLTRILTVLTPLAG